MKQSNSLGNPKMFAKHKKNQFSFSSQVSCCLFGTYIAILLNLFIANPANAQVSCNIITTVAGEGTFSGDGGPATAAKMWQPYCVATDMSGNIYISDMGNARIRKINSYGNIVTIAGNGTQGQSGDGGPATAAEFDDPYGVAVDAGGNVYIADAGNNKIRMVNTSGTITTIAGTGAAGYSGDGGPATAATLNSPAGVLPDGTGNIYITDAGNNVVRKVTAAGVITTVAGTGTASFSGDGGPATAATLNQPWGLAIDRSSNIYVSDHLNNKIRKISTSGVITSYAGTGAATFSGDGGAATAATLNCPTNIATDTSGNVYVADYRNNHIRKIATSGIITSVAGNSIYPGYTGDGGAATAAQLTNPVGVALDGTGNLFMVVGNNIRKVNSTGIITTFGGVDPNGYNGDGMAATNAELNFPYGVAADSSGNIYISDFYNYRIRKVDASGHISTFAGNGSSGFSGDGGPASSAMLGGPIGVMADNHGNVYIADTYTSGRIRKVNASGIISSIAGNGTVGYSGDGGPATNAAINEPYGLAIDRSNNIYFSDATENVVRKINSAGIISTIAGTGTYGYSGDGGAATSANLARPTGVTVDTSGNIYIADEYNNRIRKVTPGGIITTFCGNGTAGYTGDGGAATAAELLDPIGLAIDNLSNLFIVDMGNNIIRVISSSGIIKRYAGNGIYNTNNWFGGYSGDGSVATNAEISIPEGVATDNRGNVYISDFYNLRIRKVAPASYTIGTISGADTVCTGSTTLFTDSTTGGTWSIAASGLGIIDSTSGHFIAVSPGRDTVIYTASEVCGMITVRQPIEIDSFPAIGPISGVDSICPGDSAAFTDAAGTAGAWMSSNTAIATVSGTGFVTGLTPGTINIQYTLSNHGCTNSVSKSLTVRSHSACLANVNSITVTSLSLGVFPNPNKGECSVTITSPVNEQAKLEVSNIYGQKILEQLVQTNSLVDVHLNVPPGVYFISASFGANYLVKKIAIE